MVRALGGGKVVRIRDGSHVRICGEDRRSQATAAEVISPNRQAQEETWPLPSVM